MAIKNNVPYRITVEFVPPLATKNQFNSLCERMNGEHTALIGLSPQVGILAIQYENASAGTLAAIKPGVLLFKVSGGQKGPFSSAVIRSITPITNVKQLR